MAFGVFCAIVKPRKKSLLYLERAVLAERVTDLLTGQVVEGVVRQV